MALTELDRNELHALLELIERCHRATAQAREIEQDVRRKLDAFIAGSEGKWVDYPANRRAVRLHRP
jgi:hypothetical protein